MAYCINCFALWHAVKCFKLMRDHSHVSWMIGLWFDCIAFNVYDKFTQGGMTSDDHFLFPYRVPQPPPLLWRLDPGASSLIWDFLKGSAFCILEKWHRFWSVMLELWLKWHWDPIILHIGAWNWSMQGWEKNKGIRLLGWYLRFIVGFQVLGYFISWHISP